MQANPIRPEIAILSRELKRGGDVAVASIAESVVEAVPGHLIIYCLTINEVLAVTARAQGVRRP